MIVTIDELPAVIYTLKGNNKQSWFAQQAGVCLSTINTMIAQYKVSSYATFMTICKNLDAKPMFYIVPYGSDFSRECPTHNLVLWLRNYLITKSITKNDFGKLTTPDGDFASASGVYQWFYKNAGMPRFDTIETAYAMLGFSIWLEIKKEPLPMAMSNSSKNKI